MFAGACCVYFWFLPAKCPNDGAIRCTAGKSSWGHNGGWPPFDVHEESPFEPFLLNPFEGKGDRGEGMGCQKHEAVSPPITFNSSFLSCASYIIWLCNLHSLPLNMDCFNLWIAFAWKLQCGLQTILLDLPRIVLSKEPNSAPRPIISWPQDHCCLSLSFPGIFSQLPNEANCPEILQGSPIQVATKLDLAEFLKSVRFSV